jgi:hypothetical protein
MAPHLRLTRLGSGVALLGLVAAVVGLLERPAFAASATGSDWAVTLVVAAALMLAVCAGQLVLWQRGYAVWRGRRSGDLRTESRVSWLLHLVSYPVVLAALLAGLGASADAAWTTTAAAWLTAAMVLVVVAQVTAAVQYLRPEGPPGTIPAHLRRLSAWTTEQRRRADD